MYTRIHSETFTYLLFSKLTDIHELDMEPLIRDISDLFEKAGSHCKQQQTTVTQQDRFSPANQRELKDRDHQFQQNKQGLLMKSSQV